MHGPIKDIERNHRILPGFNDVKTDIEQMRNELLVMHNRLMSIYRSNTQTTFANVLKNCRSDRPKRNQKVTIVP